MGKQYIHNIIFRADIDVAINIAVRKSHSERDTKSVSINQQTKSKQVRWYKQCGRYTLWIQGQIEYIYEHQREWAERKNEREGVAVIATIVMNQQWWWWWKHYKSIQCVDVDVQGPRSLFGFTQWVIHSLSLHDMSRVFMDINDW